MSKTIVPMLDYILVEIIKPDMGVVTSNDITSTDQYGEVVAVGDGTYEFGVFVEPKVKIGDRVYWEAYAEGTNVPESLRSQGLALIKSSRIMAKEIK